jgi:L-threonylcarbamoyladenylate synthase
MRSVGARIRQADEGMEEAVQRLRAGLLVAFPTETVYGLGANALDPEAVARIFAAKGRPSTNPLIVHVTEDNADSLVQDWNQTAEALADTFWPGPLTLVMPRNKSVPDIVTAGGPTVGLRMPAHPVAQELLRRTGLPIAAPSANRSEEVSPTTAEHVAASLGPWVDDLLILDGGPCTVGLESTVVDIASNPPRILRPGMVTLSMLQEVLPNLATGASSPTDTIARSPGQMTRHYAPRTPVLIVSFPQLGGLLEPGDGLLLLEDKSGAVFAEAQQASLHHLPHNPTGYAAGLYSTLREMDEAGYRRIVIETPPQGSAWEAIHDRLRRAAAKS